MFDISKKDNSIVVRLTAQEKDVVASMASNLNMTLSDYIRFVLRKEICMG